MKHAFHILLVILIVALIATPLSAGDNCVAVRGIAQEHLLDFTSPDWQGGYPDAPWVGPVELIVGNEVLTGKLSENDGGPGPRHGFGQDRGGYYFFDFGANGTFMVQYDNSVFPNFPKFAGVAGTGTFRAQGPVNNGTDRFEGVTGNITSDGVFLAWNLDQPIPSARFNNTIAGKLCGVAPK